MSDTKKPFYPFEYNMGEEVKFTSFMTQRDAKFKKSAEEVYNNKHLDDKELLWEAFRENIEPPTPQIKEIDGYEAEEDNTSTDNTGGEGNTNTTDGETTGGEGNTTDNNETDTTGGESNTNTTDGETTGGEGNTNTTDGETAGGEGNTTDNNETDTTGGDSTENGN
jgi:hypothetical protein